MAEARIRSPAGAGPSPSTFDADRDVLLELVRRFTARDRNAPSPPHPLFGRMSAYDWGAERFSRKITLVR